MEQGHTEGTETLQWGAHLTMGEEADMDLHQCRCTRSSSGVDLVMVNS